MIPFLGIVLMTLGQTPAATEKPAPVAEKPAAGRQWDVTGQESIVIPLPGPVTESGLAFEFSLIGHSHFAAGYVDENGMRIEIRTFGSTNSFRTYLPELETDYGRIYSVRKLPTADSKEIGKFVECYLGAAVAAECFLPIGSRLNETYAALRWWPLRGISISLAITNCLPSLNVRYTL